jgi:hypothetical protein
MSKIEDCNEFTSLIILACGSYTPFSQTMEPLPLQNPGRFKSITEAHRGMQFAAVCVGENPIK